MTIHANVESVDSRSEFKRKLIAGAVLASLVSLAVVPSLSRMGAANATSNTVANAVTGQTQAGFPLNFADIVTRVQPAVVNISVTESATVEPQGVPFPEGTPLPPFLHRFFGEQGFAPPLMPRQGEASGFIIDPSGYIVTNHHVVGGADEIEVTLNDGGKYPATLVGSDPKTDLAVIKIEASQPLPHVEFGNSDEVRTGDWVLAIGNPFGLGGTVTAGIVSARGRDINSGPYDDFLQIDAPINRGNSGGPLFDGSGHAIGVNTAIFSPSGGSVGIGFAVPASLAQKVVAELREHGSIERGWLGVQIQPVTSEVAESLGLSEAKGALVAGVTPDSPADEAGLVASDVVLAVNGTPVEDARDLAKRVGDLKPGESVTLDVWREDARVTKTVRLAPTPTEEVTASAPAQAGSGRLGLELVALAPELRSHYGIADDVAGALVVGVAPGSPSAAEGIRVGDVIKMVNHAKVTSPHAVVKGVEEAVAEKRGNVLLLVDRHGEERFLAVPLV